MKFYFKELLGLRGGARMTFMSHEAPGRVIYFESPTHFSTSSNAKPLELIGIENSLTLNPAFYVGCYVNGV